MIKAEYDLMYRHELKHWWHTAKRAYIASVLSRIKPPEPVSILDIGCGTGGNVTMLSRFGSYTGIDASPYAVAYCRKRHISTVRIGNANRPKFPKESASVITLLDVLYHDGIREAAVLKSAYDTLRPGGYLLITDCAHQWLFGPHDRINRARLRYGKSQLEQSVRQAGFAVHKSTYLFAGTFPAFVIQRLTEKITGKFSATAATMPPDPINRLLISVLSLEARWLAWGSLPLGSSVLILARKP